jgi:hypothetical protein
MSDNKKGAGVSTKVDVETGVGVEAEADVAAEVDARSVAEITAEGMERYYHLAKRQAWDVRQLPWGQIAPVPEGSGSLEKRARRHSMWRSVVTQQLQADMIAVQCSTQLLVSAPDGEAKLYYTTMTSDEARHCEAWLRLSNEIGGVCEPDPYLEKLGILTMNADTLEEQIWLFQCAFEGLVIPRFHQIAAASPNTILSDLCTRIAIDDGIHHGSGVTYERLLLERSTAKTKRSIEHLSREMWPLYVQHVTWRPRERAWASSALRSRDYALVKSQRDEVAKMGAGFGMDMEFEMTM